ncbi:MAG: glutamate-5-semialdehyde dehydrogenase [Cytophagales bacterium]|nr:MAG: glutamate-5-semialdehyde dehydrogenase [Cytophagales bacterium]
MDLQFQFEKTQKASRKLALLDEALINKILLDLANIAELNIDFLITENKKDLVRMEVSNPKYDRLLLSENRIKSIASEIRNVATLPYPVGRILETKTLANQLHLQKISVPLGVVGIIYEARPNVTFDCFSLCLKSGNAVILKGSTDAEFSNLAIISLIHKVLIINGIDDNIATLLPADRSATDALLNAINFVDVIIPRGSQGLIDFVRNNSKVPVIETGAGIVHVYFDAYGDVRIAKDIIENSKTRRVSVCNSLDCLIIHKSRLSDLNELVERLAVSKVELYADEESFLALKNSYLDTLLELATPQAFGTEFLDYKMSIKTVDSFEEAIEHIATYSSKHSECIVTENETNKQNFFKMVDAAAVYANASTAFTDGAQFEMGAEIGISTQKLHARGPMALPELTSYKWLIDGNGQIRK